MCLLCNLDIFSYHWHKEHLIFLETALSFPDPWGTAQKTLYVLLFHTTVRVLALEPTAFHPLRAASWNFVGRPGLEPGNISCGN